MTSCFDLAVGLHTMSKRSPKDLKNDDFATALKEWETDHPEAWKEAAARPAPSSRKPAAEGVLADQLRDQLEKVKSSSDGEAERSASVRKAAANPEHAAGPRTKTTRRLTEAELMREAFEALDVDGYDPTAKFRGTGYSEAMDVEIIEEEPREVLPSRSASEAVKQSYTQNDRAFEELMADADVAPLDTRLDKVRDAISERTAWTREQQPEHAAWKRELSEDDLNAPTLTVAQRKLLKRAKKSGRVPELNLRHYRKHEAMTMLHDFVRAQQVHRTRFVRIITGKGKRSKEKVVIKPAVLEWCEEPQNAAMLIEYAPAPDESGNYGVVVLELRRPQ